MGIVPSGLKTVLPGWLASPIRRWLRHRSVRTYRARRVTHTYHGFPLTIELIDAQGAEWYDRDLPPLPEISALVGGRLREGARVFDVGAHQGVVAIVFGRIVGPSGQVVAVEAEPSNAAAARRNVVLNEAHQVEVVEAAAAEEPGELWFGVDHVSDGADGHRVSRVPAITVDALTERHGPPDVLFVDVEGYECHVLRGATRTLEARPDCCIEVHVGCGLERSGGSVGELRELLEGRGYELRCLRPGSDHLRPLDADPSILRDRFFLLGFAGS